MFEACETLREMTWQKKLLGVTIAFPGEQIGRSPTPLQEQCGIITVTLDDERVLIDDKSIFTTRGKLDPYFGSATSENVKNNTSMGVSILELATEVKRLLALRAWANTNRLGAYRRIIDQQLEIVTRCIYVDENIVYQDDLKYIERGSIDHRLQCVFSSRAYGTNSLLNATSHMSVSTNTLSLELKMSNRTIV